MPVFNFGIYACAPQALDINNDCPTAITLASFNTTPKSKKVILEWSTGDETDNLGFNVYRAAQRRRICKAKFLTHSFKKARDLALRMSL